MVSGPDGGADGAAVLCSGDHLRFALVSIGGGADAAGIAALEFAAGLIGRSLAVAEVSGNSIAAAAITPGFLQAVGRALVRRGEIVYGIKVRRRGGILLSPAAHWDIEGESRPESWVYPHFQRSIGRSNQAFSGNQCAPLPICQRSRA